MNTKSTQNRIAIMFLVLAILSAACGGSADTPAPTSPPPPTNTPEPPPPPQVTLGEEQRSEEGGFSFKAVSDYEVNAAFGIVEMTAPGADPDIGPFIILMGDVHEDEFTLDELYTFTRMEFDDGPVTAGEPSDVTIGGAPAKTFDLSGTEEGGIEMFGNVTVVLVSPTQMLTAIAASPANQWEEFSPVVDAVLAAITFFEATPIAFEEPTQVPVEEPEPTEDAGGEDVAPNIVAGQLNILEVNGYMDSYGDWHIIGLISNDTERDVNDIEVEIEFFDADNNSLYVDTPLTSLWAIAPGDITPFEMWVFEDMPDADHFEATIVGNGTTTLERGEIEVADVVISYDEYDDLYLTGNVYNLSDAPIDLNGLAAAVFDADGALVTASDESVLIRYLKPGESGPFRISMDCPEGTAAGLFDVADYEFYPEVVTVDSAEEYDLVFSPNGHYDYMDTWGNFHLVGEVTNNSDTILNVMVVASILDADGFVLDAASTSLPVYSIAPGETIPYDFSSWGPLSYIDSAYDAAAEYRVQFDWDWIWESSTVLVPMSTTDDSNTFDDYSGTFIGYMVNDTGGTVDGATIVVALYDIATGQLVAMDYDWTLDEIPNGEQVAYEVSVDIPEGFDPASVEYVITVWGEIP